MNNTPNEEGKGKDILSDMPEVLPVLPLKDMVIFPEIRRQLFVGRARSVQAVKEAMAGAGHIFIVTQRSPEMEDPGPADLFSKGLVAVCSDFMPIEEVFRIIVEGIARAQIQEYTQINPYPKVRVEIIHEPEGAGAEVQALLKGVLDRFARAMKLMDNDPLEQNFPEEARENARQNRHGAMNAAKEMTNPGLLADYVACYLAKVSGPSKQKVLETLDVAARLKVVTDLLDEEIAAGEALSPAR